MSPNAASTHREFDDDAPRAPTPVAARESWLNFDRVFIATACTVSIGFFVTAYSISAIDPDYFSRRILSTMRPVNVDPIETGAVAAKPAEGGGMPVPRVVRVREPVPADYQIVTVFDDEAILATADELVRVKVGSVVPGLGEILRIEATATGGIVGAAAATLRSVD